MLKGNTIYRTKGWPHTYLVTPERDVFLWSPVRRMWERVPFADPMLIIIHWVPVLTNVRFNKERKNADCYPLPTVATHPSNQLEMCKQALPS